MTKKKFRKRIQRLEEELAAARFAAVPTFDTVTICWTDRTVNMRGRTIQAGESDCLSFPVLSA